MSTDQTSTNGLERFDCTTDNIPNEVLTSSTPLILRGLVDQWQVVSKAKKSNSELSKYILEHYSGINIGAFVGSTKIKGRYFYNEEISELNFEKHSVKLDVIMSELQKERPDNATPSLYVGSAHIDKLLPEFRKHNDLTALSDFSPLASIWISNQSRIAAHNDFPTNIACCIAGSRTFTLFPPDQACNLYIGPLEKTPAGQAISLVDFHNPDYERFPNFKLAQKSALTVTLKPGDALLIPSMWWHHVESHCNLNVLVNYWWTDKEANQGAPMDALLHSILNIRNLSVEQKKAWQAMFNHYVFSNDDSRFEHIPVSQQGILNSKDQVAARQLRSHLLNKLNK